MDQHAIMIQSYNKYGNKNKRYFITKLLYLDHKKHSRIKWYPTWTNRATDFLSDNLISKIIYPALYINLGNNVSIPDVFQMTSLSGNA